jgi:hypothetical protein
MDGGLDGSLPSFGRGCPAIAARAAGRFSTFALTIPLGGSLVIRPVQRNALSAYFTVRSHNLASLAISVQDIHAAPSLSLLCSSVRSTFFSDLRMTKITSS